MRGEETCVCVCVCCKELVFAKDFYDLMFTCATGEKEAAQKTGTCQLAQLTHTQLCIRVYARARLTDL